MNQPRIDVREVQQNIRELRSLITEKDECIECALGALNEIDDELFDTDDGATILVAFTPREAEVIEKQLAAVSQAARLRGTPNSIPYQEVVAASSALEEIRAAIRGVVVPK